MHNVLVTGAADPLGRRLVEHLRQREGIGRVVGVEPATSSEWIEGVELVAFDADHRALVEFLNDNEIDTVLHCGLAPDRSGRAGGPREARVIETMRLGAAIAHPDVAVAAWVVASSTAVYPASSQSPLLHREDGDTATDEAVAGSLLEAEDYVRDVARRSPHMNVSILRLQQLVGPGVAGPLSALLSQPLLPAVVGYDALVQLLAIEDAVAALVFAAEIELAGVYNVASVGCLRWSEARRALGRPSLPVLPFEAGPLAPLARRVGIPHVPDGLLDLLRFGHVVDTAKLASAGFQPAYDQDACLGALSRHPDEVLSRAST